MAKFLSLSLRLQALVFLLFAAFVIVTVLFGQNVLSEFFYRGEEFHWDYELMFAGLFFVWSIFLWRASYDPAKHASFIDFTIVANAMHIAVMIVIGLIDSDELLHLLTDGFFLFAPTVLIVYFLTKVRRSLR